MKIMKPVFGGYGLGFDNNKTYFIEKAVPDDDIIPYIYKKRKGVFFGRIDSFISRAPNRIEPECPYFQQCAGCSYQIVPYKDELELKKDVFEETIKRISGLDCCVSGFIESDNRFFYRNKIEASIKTDPEGMLNIGFHRRDDWRKVIDIADCRIANRDIQSFYSYFRGFLQENRSFLPRELTHFSMRSSQNGEILLVLWFKNLPMPCVFLEILDGIRHEKLKGIKAFNSITERKKETEQELVFARGCEMIEDVYQGRRLAMSSESFFQVNPYITQKLIEKLSIVARGKRPDLMLDLFAGSGFWGIMLKDFAERVTGVELSSLSEAEFNYNKKINNIENYEFIRSDIKHYLRERDTDTKTGMIVLDPPRAGVSPKIINKIMDIDAQTILYISCNPSTFARDIGDLSSRYRIEEIMLFDMFPCTFHVESLAHLENART